jgi:hypothetical protein
VQKDYAASGKHRGRRASGSNDFVFYCDRSQRINCLCVISGIVVPRIPALPAPAILAGVPEVAGVAPGTHAAMLPIGGKVVALPIVGETLGIVGIEEPSAGVPAIGNGLGSGTAGVELTPRLPIS